MALSKTIAIAAAAWLASFSAAFSEQQGTPEQREACTSDAFRLCGRFIPDADRITDCLRASGPRLSAACYAVFYPPRASADPRPSSPRRRYAPAPRFYDQDDDD